MEFDEAVHRLIFDHEKGYVNDPNDPGGETKYGISKRSYPNEDIKNLTVARAKEIYKRDFWDFLNLSLMPERTRYMIFDMSVLQGAVTAAKTVQRSCGAYPDGRIGPLTLAAVDRMEERVFVRDLFARRCKRLAMAPTVENHGRGWYGRMFDLAEEYFIGE